MATSINWGDWIRGRGPLTLTRTDEPSAKKTGTKIPSGGWNFTNPSHGLGNMENIDKWLRGGGTFPTGPPPPPPPGPRRRTPPGAGGGAAAAAAAAAAAEAAAAMTRAGNRYKSQSENLDPQIAALKHALDVSFKQGLDQNLGDIGRLVGEQTEMLKSSAAKRALDFLAAARNSEFATAGQAEDSLSNLVRERQDTMTAVLEQGAGETDALRALVASARNWRANAQEGNRAYFDSMQSINQSITDLNMDTQSALANVHTQGESERERLWQDFYNRRGETLTQLGNLYTQQADYLEQAKEMKVGEGGGSKKDLAGTAFMDAAKEAGKSYEKQALPGWISDYKGQEQVAAKAANTDLAATLEFAGPKRAEGSALRRWR